MDNTKQHWLAEEKEDLLSSGENDQRSYALRPALKRLLTKVLSHSARAIAYRRGKRLAYCFVPSPLRAYYWNEIPPKAKQFPTTYLTGMRGIAAVKVYTFHYLHFFSDATFVPWGRDDQHKLFLELPIVQFLYAGTTAQIFFVVAGYLMTLQIVQLFDKHEPASRSKAFLNISGALFRRFFRLYLPTFVITLITAHYIYLGLYEHNRNFYNQRDKYFPGPWTEPMPQQYSSYVAQMENWAQDMWGLMNLWAKTYRPQHDVHLWSILVEMQSSLVLYLILMATAQCRKLVRLAAMTIMTVVTLFWDHGETWMYVIGAVVALIDLLLTEREQQKKLTLPTTKAELPATTLQGDGWKSRWSFILRSHFRDPTTTAWTVSSRVRAPDRLLDPVVSHVGLRVLGFGCRRSRLRDSQQIHPAEHGPKRALLALHRHDHLPASARPCRPRYIVLAKRVQRRLGAVSRQDQLRAVPRAGAASACGGVFGAALGLVVNRRGRHREQQFYLVRWHHDWMACRLDLASLVSGCLAAGGGDSDCQGGAEI